MARPVLIILLAIIALLPFSCSLNHPATPNFDMLFLYGVTLKNELDTFNNTYTKDMISAPAITVNLRLTNQDKQKILEKMMEISFFDYPDKFAVMVPPGQPTRMVTPYSRYYFHVEYGSKKKDLSWEDNIIVSDKKAEKLRELIQFIQNIVEAKDEYKKLPMPSGGYL